MSQRARRLAGGAGAGAGAIGLFLLLPSGGLAQAVLMVCSLLVAMSLLVSGVRRLAPDDRRSWGFLLAGEALYAIATAVWYLGPVGFRIVLPYPSLLDLAFLTSYALMAAFFVQLLRARRGGDETDLSGAGVDTLAVAVAAAVVAEELLVAPALADAALLTAAGAASVAYPVFLVVLFGLSVQVVVRRRVPVVSAGLFTLWIGGELVADVWYVHASLDGTFRFGHPMFAGWLVSYAALGTMALGLGRPGATVPAGHPVSAVHPRRELLVLSGAVGVLVVMDAYQHNSGNVLARLGGEAWLLVGLALFLLRIRGLLRDVELERRLRADVERLADELEHAATHDPLTGLLNRRSFEDSIGRALVDRHPPGRAVALVMADLDAFKAVNDTYGHPVGDEMLREAASRLREVTRPSDVVARLGGDEFAIVLDQGDVRTAMEVARRVAAALAAPVTVRDLEVAVGVSVGVHVAGPGEDHSAAVSNVDAALYAAKRAGGGCELFDPLRHRSFIDRYQLELDLRAAVTRGGFLLHYQPIVDLATREIVGVEALLRWEHPARGFLSPAEFISVAEESGAIVEVGRWVLRQACADCRSWQERVPGAARVGVAVNVSRRQLRSGSIVDEVSDVLAVTGLAPKWLTLEITETALAADDGEMIALLEKFSALGVELAMDDFGTGYSSLAQLRTMPIGILKIDKAFVDGIAREEEEWALAAAIVRLATSLDKRTLAEGIERAAQLAHLRSLGCQQGQGYLFARPMPLAELEALLASGPSVA